MSEKRTRLRPEQQAVLVVCLLFVSLTLTIIGVVYWAISDDDSESAATVRQLIGIQEKMPVEPPKPPVEVVEVIPEVEPMVEEPAEPPPPPKVTFSELASKSRYWPKELILETENHIEIIFNGQSFGHIDLVRGSTIRVESLSNPELISGVIADINVTIPASHTNLEAWFQDYYQGKLELIPLSRNRSEVLQEDAESSFSESEFLSDFKKWCYLYYESVDFELAEDTLIFRWSMKDSGLVNYRDEARRFARNYLNQQRSFGGLDNWAACEIRHPETDLVLGRASVFMPSL
ncbi:hypothetical protein [Rubellicoccus peritrichatus]|uniref:Uncharacterized protein n=1 Tax=Rubellicoccus peritrichatus TaxID=3080537 RepID=A0AAQ3L9S4_9BACT|nr:hypothetical protein [Puniceicoccus sp. CR14]WOO41721.1 hypothetical protein RZN69_01375 [Puniceicoccus sp. CR14]